jgi:hypothetical protein
VANTLEESGVELRAREALSGSPIGALRDLQVELVGEALMISGTVASFYHKQLAQEAVRAVAEGLELINSVDVV